MNRVATAGLIGGVCALLAACSDSGEEAKAADVKPANPSTPAKPATPAAAQVPEAQGTVDMAELLKPGALPDKQLGKDDAKVTIVEYASMTCPHCAAFNEKVFPQIKSEYIDSNKIRLGIEAPRDVSVDPRRVSIWGASMGGAGATTIGLHHPDRFATVTSFFGDAKYDLSTYVRALLPDEAAAHRVNALDVVDNARHVPVWLIHGEADDNTGTFPIQSERMYQAMKGNGATVRLVMLPHEAHGYAGRESIEHVLYEMISWFDKYVKHAPPRTGQTDTTNK